MAYIPRSKRKFHSQRRRSFFFLPRINTQYLIFYGVVSVIVLIITGYIGALGLFAWYGRDLPEPGKLSETRQNSTVFYDRNDKVIYELYQDKNRIPIDFEDLPKDLLQATVAIEDKRFYEHDGISELGIMRALIFSAMGNPQGGSTITQQLIKNVLLTSERRLSRKIKEAILAYEVEKKYSKEEILTMYLNEAPYGGEYWGIGSAAKGYFDKDPKKLTLLESAFLAGLPQSPSRYSPFVGETDAWKGRTKDVLGRMKSDGYITKEQQENAEKSIDKLKFKKQSSNIMAPHFVFYIKDIIEKQYGSALLTNGVKVKTTLDLDLQKTAQSLVEDEIEALEDLNVGNGALLAMDPKTGEIITYVGSADFSNEEFGKFDVISQGVRQPGSTLKPIEYAVALQNGYTASSVIMDVKTTFPNVEDDDYIPKNYDNKYLGPVQMRFALGNSRNVPAVKMLAMVGIRNFLQQAYDMGLDSLEPTNETIADLGLSASLGGGATTLLDLVQAYGVFARGGSRVEPYGILEITDFNGKTIYKQKNAKAKEVLPKEVAFIISHILSDNNARFDTFGATSYLNVPGRTVAVKSGTTDDKRDNWAVGYTNSIVLGVWVGNNDNKPMKEIASGATGASSLWYSYMLELLTEYEDGIMEQPDTVIATEVDALLGGLPRQGSPTRSEYFIEGTQPTETSPYYKKFKLSKSNGKIANEIEVNSGNYEEKEFIYIEEQDPVSLDGENRWQQAIDEWAKEQEDSRYKYPTEKSDSSGEDVSVSIKSPSNESKVDSNDVEVRVKIVSAEPIKEVKIWINSEEKKSISGDREEIIEKFNLINGKYEIKVKATNEKGKSSESSIKIGINENWQ
ncbi:MAG: transglycosylase domain-containing protein [bacterium]|nr:transglycosylase domain-containing protein [bacterium]